MLCRNLESKFCTQVIMMDFYCIISTYFLDVANFDYPIICYCIYLKMMKTKIIKSTQKSIALSYIRTHTHPSAVCS